MIAEGWNLKFMMTFPAPNHEFVSVLSPAMQVSPTSQHPCKFFLLSQPFHAGNFLVCLAIIKDPFPETWTENVT